MTNPGSSHLIILDLFLKWKRWKDSALTTIKEDLAARKERQEVLEAKLEEMDQAQSALNQTQDVFMENQAKLEAK